MKRRILLKCCLAAMLMAMGTVAQALDKVDNVYQIGSLDDYKAFAELVRATDNKANAVLIADIDLGEDATMIGTNAKPYSGVFDGQGHTISIAWKDAVYDCGIFQYMAGTVRNIRLTGSVQSINQHPSTLVGRAHSNGGTVIENVYCDVEMNITKGYDTGGGGIIAFAEGNYKMNNVVFAGKIIGDNVTEHCGGFVGWSAGAGEITNCLFAGEVTGVAFNTLNSFNIVSRGSGASWSGFYYVPVGTEFIPSNVTEVSNEEVASGALAFALNGNEQGGTNFYQNIGEDAAPVPFSDGHAKVYCKADAWLCNGTPQGNKEFTNTPQQKTQPDHDMEDGFCSLCGTWDKTWMQPAEDGWFEVSNEKQLAWWSHQASADRACKMRLTDDIEMDETANEHYAAPGTSAKPFYGCIDGQFHTISGLELNGTADPIGLIAVMSSQASQPTDAAAARAAEPSFIRNLRLDNTCTVNGSTHVGGFVGQIREWAGNVLLENLGMEGTVNGSNGVNCGGIFGCAPGAENSCTINLRNSYVSGSVHGVAEDGLLAGWMGNYATVENCYGIGECDAPRADESYLCYPIASIVLKNVYSLNGTQGIPVSQEEVSNGTLCANLVGNAYNKLAWFQSLGDDAFPVNDPTHGIVVKAGEDLLCITGDSDIPETAEALVSAELSYLEEAVAAQAEIDKCREKAQALASQTAKDDFLEAYTQMLLQHDTVVASTKVYEAYKAKCEEVTEYMDTHHDFIGPDRDALEEYLKSDAAPSEDWPLGGYTYIITNHLAADSLVTKEIDRVQEMLNKAIAGGYQPGMDVTSLLENPDLSDGNNGWDGMKFSTYSAKIGDNDRFAGEAYTQDSINISQTLTGLRPGYYKFTVNAFTKVNGNRYNYENHTLLYANDNCTFVPVALEDMMTPDKAEDLVNCNITGQYSDQIIYDDGYSTTKTDDNDTVGYVPLGLGGMVYAINGNRYQTSVMGKVGDDGTLTVGMRRNASGKLSFQLLFGNAKLEYCGNDADDVAAKEMKDVLDGQLARANTILTKFNISDVNQDPSRNFPTALKQELQQESIEAEAAEGFADTKVAVDNMSTLFVEIVEGKEAYAAMRQKADLVESIVNLLSGSIDEGDLDVLYAAIDSVNNAYEHGSVSAKEAREMDLFDNDIVLNLVPQQSADGVYQIANSKQMLAFASIVNNDDNAASADLLADLDMTGIAWMPIGTSASPYKGTFNGQGHRFSNLAISTSVNYTGLFGYVADGAVIRNFVVDNTCTIEGASYTAVIGGNTGAGKIVVEGVGMEGTVNATGANVAGLYGTNMGSKANLYITNCYVTGSVTGGRESAALCGWSGGKIGTFTNCWTTSDVSGYYYADGTDYIIRNLNVVMKHVFSTKGAQGTIITDEMLASGAICYILNEGNTTNPKWYQTLGTDPYPVLDATHGVVGMKADSTFTNQSAEWLNAPELILDIAFREDGTAYDASPMQMNVDTTGVPTVYYNEELKRNVARFDNTWGKNADVFYKVDFEQNMLFRSGLDNSHTLEMLVLADYEDAMPDVTAKPFSAMQTGGTGFETAAVDGARQFRFNPDASPLYISTYAYCDSKVTPEANRFYHVVGVWDCEAGEARIYVDGELTGTSKLPGHLVFPTVGCNWFGIGGDPSTATKASNAWRGDIAIARVYSSAITAEQVTELYKSTGTGIADAVADTSAKSTGIYTINGIRVQKTTKGLYIINGKKVLVK